MNVFLMVIADFFEKVGNWCFLIMSMILGILSPVASLYHVIIIFTVLNMFSGVIDDFKQGQKFQYVKFKIFLLRVLFYVITITVVFLFERYIVSEFELSSKYLTATCAALIALFEIHSFLCNASRITNNPVFLSIFNKIQSFFRKKTDNDSTEIK
jgi:hypothetical protein